MGNHSRYVLMLKSIFQNNFFPHEMKTKTERDEITNKNELSASKRISN